MVWILVVYATVAAVVMAVASYSFGRTGVAVMKMRCGERDDGPLYAMIIGMSWPVFLAMAPIWALCFLPGMLGARMRGRP